ncbi:hypothetical protein GH714_027697 [Hevea brasiliensis]|uniref:Cytochrome P450 n=1 Tax=Hevea brasiliensis TaxID=3981 RepID=A0A6A6MLH9_HEVBR|nr:hypothetical protein GH714_027697 [Hevea brasiliensis]
MELVMFPVLAIAATLFLLVLNQSIKALKTRFLPSPNLPPGSLGWPLIGETPAFFQASLEAKPEKFIRERMEKYDSRVFKTSLLGEPSIVFCGTAGHKFIFSNENKLVNLWWPSSTRKLFKSSLVNLVGDEAKRIRKMLMTFLSPDALKSFTERIDMVTQEHIRKHWDGKEEGLSFPINIPGTRFYRAMKAANVIRKELKLIVRQRREALEKKIVSPPQDLLSYLLVNADTSGKFLSEIEIIDNILLLLFAGHDTSRSALTLLMKYLAEMPQVYAKVLQEHLDIAKSKEQGEFLHWEDVQKMSYSWSVISEVLRLSPPVTGAYRQSIADFTYEGYTIPKGWKLHVSIGSTHKDPALFPNPENFDASRFEGGSGAAPYSIVTFGGGPRMCIGYEFARLEMLVFLHNIIRRFKWEVLMPQESFGYDPMLAPSHGFPLRLKPLQSSLSVGKSMAN